MVKERYVRNIQQAKTSNVRQLHSLKLLISGLDIDKSHFCLNVAETAFGKWFYNEAVFLISERSRPCIKEIEANMLEFHDHFLQIYTLYYRKRASNLLALLGIKREPTDQEKRAAEELYEAMIPLTDQMRRELKYLIEILEKTPNETFLQLSRMLEKQPLTA